jgi:uncharacterized GH25 family protein
MALRIRLWAALFITCCVLWARTQETRITVIVTNQHDKPVSNATVILDFLGSHQIMKLGKRKAVHWELHTNQEGIAHFPPIPQGAVQVQVISENHQTFGQVFEIDTPEKNITVKLNPPQRQYTANPEPKQK